MPETGPKSPGSDSLPKRLIFYSLGGVITVLLYFVPMTIMGNRISDYLHNSRHISVFEFVQINSPARTGFWSHIYADIRHGFQQILPGVPILGIVLGISIGVFARRLKTPGHLLPVSLCVGFLFSCYPSVLFLCGVCKPQELLVFAPFSFVWGTIVGGGTVCFARLAERTVDKIRKRKITTADRIDFNSNSESLQSK